MGSKKEGITLIRNPERMVLEFWDSEKVRGIPNELFHSVVTTIIFIVDVSMILIDGGSSYDIMYSHLFVKMGLKKEKLWPYEGSDLQVFNKIITCLWGYIELTTTKDSLHFLLLFSIHQPTSLNAPLRLISQNTTNITKLISESHCLNFQVLFL